MRQVSDKSILWALFALAGLLTSGVAASAGERPSKRVMPPPQCNRNAVVWRSPEPPANPEAGDVWVSPQDGKAMVFVPAGEFVMGSAAGDADAYSDERPQRRVYVDGFWIDKHEVTVAQYRRFCQAARRKMPSAPSWGWKNNHPVVNVTWDDAAAYARWAGKRLPTEAEWEKAARGTDGRMYPWGNEKPGAGGRWRCDLDGRNDGYASTAPVGTYPSGASPYGCLDLAGNVWEWCADWWGKDYYASAPARNPKGPASGEHRVLRGGSWYNSAKYVRCAERATPPVGRIGNGGFRCGRTP